jgi:hypothetical protein
VRKIVARELVFQRASRRGRDTVVLTLAFNAYEHPTRPKNNDLERDDRRSERVRQETMKAVIMNFSYNGMIGAGRRC